MRRLFCMSECVSAAVIDPKSRTDRYILMKYFYLKDIHHREPVFKLGLMVTFQWSFK